MTMWEIVSWALTARNSGCWCTYPHCVMTMLQLGDDNVGNCVLCIDNDEFRLFVSIPHCVMTLRQRGDDNVGNCVMGLDNEEFRLLVSIPTLCNDNAASG